jgi:hypothetical protein
MIGSKHFQAKVMKNNVCKKDSKESGAKCKGL